MLNFFKFQSINLVTLTSYSSQLSFLIAQQYFVNEKKETNKYPKDIYLVFIYPSTSDPFANNSVEIKKFFKVNRHNRDSRIFVIKTLKIWQRVLLSPFFYFLKLSIKKPIYLWQARYKMLEDSLKFRPRILFKIKINIPVPKFKLVLFGDGFLSLMPVNRAFWLEQNKKKDYLNHSRLLKSYHLYSAGNNFNKYKSKKLCPNEVKKYLIMYLKNKYDLRLIDCLDVFVDKYFTNKKFNKIYIFPTTTFYETGRTSLENEINIYKDFLKKSKIQSCSHLIIKPHPASCFEKNYLFFKKLENDDFFKSKNIINPFDGNDKLIFSNISLELIITYLFINSVKINISRNIILACCSTATISVKNLYPSLILDQAFGKLLLKKYLYPSFIKQRLKQEEVINNLINNIES